MILGKDTNASLSADAARIARVLAAGESALFTAEETAQALGVSECEVLRRVICGEIDSVCAAGDVRIPWAELISAGLDAWDSDAFEEALVSANANVPELLRTATVHLRLPRLIVVALEHFAQREGRTVSAILASELRDFVSVHAELLSRDIAGFAEALAWPDQVE